MRKMGGSKCEKKSKKRKKVRESDAKNEKKRNSNKPKKRFLKLSSTIVEFTMIRNLLEKFR